MKMEPVDVVYTWVDGDCPEHRRLRESYATDPHDLNPERFRDPFQMLRYSLRSVRKYADWVGQIFLLVQRDQWPSWLDRSHPRFRQICHDEVFPDPSLLPTFNSSAIETCLDRVPTTGDRFLYLNDDFLFGAPTRLEDFVGQDGRIRIWGLRTKPLDWLVSKSRLEHAPVLFSRTFLRQIEAEQPQELARIRALRFRRKPNLGLITRYRDFLLRNGGEAVPARHIGSFHQVLRLTNDWARQARMVPKVLSSGAKILCMNDDMGPSPDPRVEALVRRCLQEAYPDPAPWEL